MKIKKGDNVIVITGKDKTKTGAVLRVFPKKDMVLVEGVNVVKRHQRSRRNDGKGQILDKAMPIHISNVALSGEKKAKAPKKAKAVK